jgi:hypothetical protein
MADGNEHESYGEFMESLFTLPYAAVTLFGVKNGSFVFYRPATDAMVAW